MEPAQKRQRTAATTMQRVCELPKELQVSILMWAMEPTPTAAIMKAAIGNAYGEQSWWTTVVGKDNGYQMYLNRHTHCYMLWARALEVRHDGSLAWTWSQTNVFVNRTGRAHVRGIWADLENEVAIRRNVRGKLPLDDYVGSDMARELHMIVPTWDFKSPNPSHEIWMDTCGYAIVNEPTDGRFRLQWGDDATRHTSLLNGLWHSAQRVRDFHRKVLGQFSECASA
jgi:hypothetical protein